MLDNMLRNQCPICGTSRPRDAAFERDFSGMRDIVPFAKYDVVVCQECGMVYASNIEESQPIEEYYDILSKYSSNTYAEFGGVSERHRILAKYICSYVSKTTPILDIGCADGSLLEALKLEGYKYLDGIEVSDDNVLYARNEYHLNVYEGMWNEDISAHINKKYGLIIMEGVLEHILPLHETLQLCKRKLLPDGMMFFGVPCLELFKEKNDLYQEFSVEHVNFFSRQSLTNMMQIHGFKLVDIQCDILPYELNGLYQLDDINKNYIYDYHGGDDLAIYLENCKTLLGRLRNFISTVNGPYYIWGAGTHTAMLYQAGIFNPENVIGIIDSNRNFQGHSIFGCEIKDARNIKDNYPIIISSKDAEKSIMKYAKEKLHLTNQLVSLY